jgi:uncharacterized membrane protein YphA (DoxX/SURF4 family)
MKIVFLTLRIALGLLFLYAGWVKSMASDQFLFALIPFTFLPIEVLPWVAKGLPLVEILAGVLLLAGFRKAGGVLVLLMCAVFISVLGWALMNDIIVACSCFGKDETPSAGKMWLAIGRDVGLAAVALGVIFEKRVLGWFGQ